LLGFVFHTRTYCRSFLALLTLAFLLLAALFLKFSLTRR